MVFGMWGDQISTGREYLEICKSLQAGTRALDTPTGCRVRDLRRRFLSSRSVVMDVTELDRVCISDDRREFNLMIRRCHRQMARFRIRQLATITVADGTSTSLDGTALITLTSFEDMNFVAGTLMVFCLRHLRVGRRGGVPRCHQFRLHPHRDRCRVRPVSHRHQCH
ncbi:MAG: hypothetical protein R3C01_17560 [Planctomycetaceae bacterium]